MQAWRNGLEKELARALVENNALLLGDFTLSSGKKSPVYIDMRALLSSPRGYRVAATALAAAIASCTGVGDYCVAGVATGGIAWATLAAYMLGLPSGYVRAGRKPHGLSRSVEGCRGASRVVVVDDVATTGGSLLSAVKALRENGYSVEAAAVLVDREQGAREALTGIGVQFCSVTTLTGLLAAAASLGLMPREEVERALRELGAD